MANPRIGGSFAPPLTDELLAKCEAMAKSMDAKSQTRYCFEQLLACCQAWWNLPYSNGDGKPHPSGRGTIVFLSDEHQAKLWELIPWPQELSEAGRLFGEIGDKTLRDAAHQLLWHVCELNLDREPINFLGRDDKGQAILGWMS